MYSIAMKSARHRALADFVDGADVGMVNRRRAPSLDEPLQPVGVLRKVVGQNLQRAVAS
jgi:hypothetical protein